MSLPEVVFLHIPKAAGTSLQHNFVSHVGREHVFWIGKDSSPHIRRYPRHKLQDSFVVCGHKPLAFYPHDIDPLYCALLRDPVERAVSLFAYYTQPDQAAIERDQQVRSTLRREAVARGLDPDSMLNSLRQCASFRLEVSDQQCRYLSRGRATLDGVLSSLCDCDHLIGTVSRYERFHRALCQLLDWQDVEPVQINRGKDEYAAAYLADSELVALLAELNVEDRKLLDWMESEHQGLWQQLRDGDQRRTRLQRVPGAARPGSATGPTWADAAQFWPRRESGRLKWPLSRMLVVDEVRLAYMPTSGPLDEVIQRLMLQLSPVCHQEAALRLGLNRVTEEFVTGLLLQDRSPAQIQQIAARDYFKFAVIYEPVTRLVELFRYRFVELGSSLSRWPGLGEMVAGITAAAGQDDTAGISFRQFVGAVVSGKHNQRLWLPQSRYLSWTDSYDRLYRPDCIAGLAGDLARLRGLSIASDFPPCQPVRVTRAGAARYADTPAAKLPADFTEWRDAVVDESLLALIRRYYAADFQLYNRAAAQHAEVARA